MQRLIYATPMLFMMGYAMIHEVGAPSRFVNNTRNMACLTGSATEWHEDANTVISETTFYISSKWISTLMGWMLCFAFLLLHILQVIKNNT